MWAARHAGEIAVHGEFRLYGDLQISRASKPAAANDCIACIASTECNLQSIFLGAYIHKCIDG
jgi:hypothetical protein